jgi:hypothetical protein
MLKALFWKEWQEQRWRLALACIGLIGFTAIGLKTRILPDSDIITITLLLSVLILPAFAGMGLLASEHGAGTFKHLLAQPIPRWKLLLSKVGMGLMSYTAPILVTCVVVCLTVGGRELPTARLLATYVAFSAFGVLVLAWSLLIGIRCPRDDLYILVNIVVLVAWCVQGLIVDEFELTRRLGQWVWNMNPFALIELLDGPSPTVQECLLVITVQGVVLLGLGYGVWFRFNRINRRGS